MRFLIRSLLTMAVLLVSVPALAAPITYGWTAGTITVQATQSSDNALVFDETLALSTDSFMEWDPTGTAGFGVGSLDDFLLRIDGAQGPFATLIDYGPYNMVTVETADIAPDFVGGYGTLFSFGGSIQVGGIDIDATYSASHSSGFPPPAGPTPADITGVSNMSATLTFGPGASTVQLSAFGIVMGTVDGTPFGEAGNDLNLTANITFFGDSNVTPTPEPGTALMLGMGLVALAVRKRAV